VRRLAPWLPLVGVFVWVALANFHAVANNDIFLHLRVGELVVHDHAVPSVDEFSATASGRPFIAHEWLSAVTFYGVDELFGGKGLTVLGVLIALASAGLLLASVPREARTRPGVAFALVVAMYLFTLTSEVRPHLYTQLILCGYAFAIERWRRRGGWRPLVWLILVQVLWVNLHGGYLFGPVLLAVLAGSVAVQAASTRLCSDGERAYTWADFRCVAAVALACVVASCLNPYGPRIFWFSIELSLRSEYMRSLINEWKSPFAGFPWLVRFEAIYVFIAALVLLWAGILRRIRGKPLVDAAYALLVTVVAVRARRFIPFVGILGFPIAVRSLPRGRPWLRICEGVLVALLVVATPRMGFVISNVERYPMGWGFGGEVIGYEGVEVMKRLGLRGVVLDEYVDGGYLIYRLYPDVRPVVDSRIDIYGEKLHRELLDAASSKTKLYAYLAKYNVNIVLLSPASEHVFQSLQTDPNWELAYAGPTRFLFVRRAGVHRI